MKKAIHNPDQTSLMKPSRGTGALGMTPKFRGVTGAHKPLGMGNGKVKGLRKGMK